MTLSEDSSRADVLSQAGLPRDAVTAWRASGGAVGGDYARDGETFSRQWRLGAELLAKLPRKPARSPAQAAAAVAILQRDRAAREKFLEAHAVTVYRRLTGDLTKFKRVEHL